MRCQMHQMILYPVRTSKIGYYGVNDPVADKMMRRAETMPKLETPSDKTVTTLYVGGLDNRITEKDLRCVFSLKS